MEGRRPSEPPLLRGAVPHSSQLRGRRERERARIEAVCLTLYYCPILFLKQEKWEQGKMGDDGDGDDVRESTFPPREAFPVSQPSRLSTPLENKSPAADAGATTYSEGGQAQEMSPAIPPSSSSTSDVACGISNENPRGKEEEEEGLGRSVGIEIRWYLKLNFPEEERLPTSKEPGAPADGKENIAGEYEGLREARGNPPCNAVSSQKPGQRCINRKLHITRVLAPLLRDSSKPACTFKKRKAGQPFYEPFPLPRHPPLLFCNASKVGGWLVGRWR